MKHEGTQVKLTWHQLLFHTLEQFHRRGKMDSVSTITTSSSSLHSIMTISSTNTAGTPTSPDTAGQAHEGLHLAIPMGPNGSPVDLRRSAFRRTYSSNSIKRKTVEVTPSSFVKIRLLGKGDVGRVYLVRKKDTDKLYAMKGIVPPTPVGTNHCHLYVSVARCTC